MIMRMWTASKERKVRVASEERGHGDINLHNIKKSEQEVGNFRFERLRCEIN